MKIVKWLLFLLIGAGFAILLLCVFTVPYVATETAKIIPEYGGLRIPVMLFIYLTTLPFYNGLYHGINICREILQGKEFTHQNVASLVRISHCAFSVAALYFIGISILYTLKAMHPSVLLLSLVIIFISVAIAIFSASLSYFIKKAVVLQEENEQTI